MRLTRQKATIIKVSRISAMVLDGKRSHEIAETLKISPQRVRHLCRTFGVRLPASSAYRLAFQLPAASARIVFAIAKELGLSNADVLSMVVRSVSDDGADGVRRAISKFRKPKRKRRLA